MARFSLDEGAQARGHVDAAEYNRVLVWEWYKTPLLIQPRDIAWRRLARPEIVKLLSKSRACSTAILLLSIYLTSKSEQN